MPRHAVLCYRTDQRDAGFDGGTLQDEAATGATFFCNAITVGATGGALDSGGSRVVQLPNTISGTGNLTYTGAGVFQVSKDSHTGATLVTGTARLEGTAAGSLTSGSAFAVFNGASIELSGFNQTIAAVGGNGTVVSDGGPATLTISGSTSGSFSGTLQNSTNAGTYTTLTLVKQGAGTQALSGSSSFSGGTTIDGGVLEVDSVRRVLPHHPIGEGLRRHQPRVGAPSSRCCIVCIPAPA